MWEVDGGLVVIQLFPEWAQPRGAIAHVVKRKISNSAAPRASSPREGPGPPVGPNGSIVTLSP
jgi:hypothetical protein